MKNFDAGSKVTVHKKLVCEFPAGVARRWQWLFFTLKAFNKLDNKIELFKT